MSGRSQEQEGVVAIRLVLSGQISGLVTSVSCRVGSMSRQWHVVSPQDNLDRRGLREGEEGYGTYLVGVSHVLSRECYVL